MLPSAELGKGNHHNTTDYLKLFTAGYPKLCDFYSMAFFLLVLASMPLCIKNTIAILAPGSNTFAVFVKCIHVRTVFITQPAVINIVPILLLYNYNKFHIS
jgi:hypothetical protein